jgi:hypothetical protein
VASSRPNSVITASLTCYAFAPVAAFCLQVAQHPDLLIFQPAADSSEWSSPGIRKYIWGGDVHTDLQALKFFCGTPTTRNRSRPATVGWAPTG